MKKRLFALALAFLMLMSAFASCGGGGNDSKDTTVAPSINDTTDASVTEEPKPEPEYVHDGKTFDGAECLVLIAGIAGKSDIDFNFQTENPTVVDQALYTSQSKVEEEKEVKFSYLKETGYSTRKGIQRITEEYTAGDSSYAFSYIAAYDLMSLANSNCLYDLNSAPNIDLSKSFWDQNAVEDFTSNGVTFFSTGDITILDDILQFVIIFNKDLMRETNPDVNLYDEVESGKWTLDKFVEYSKNFTEDIDGNDKLDMSDKFGILMWDDIIYAGLNASGERIVSYNKAESAFELSLYSSERAVNVLSSWFDIQDSEAAINRSRFNQSDGTLSITAFIEDRALFFMPMMLDVDNIRDMDTDYGFLPYPKYDDTQTRYYTSTSAYHMAYICTTNTDIDIDMRGAVMQALAYYRQQYLTPAYYEKTLVGKSVRDDESVLTLDILSSTRIYDVGFIIKPADIQSLLISNFRTGRQNFANLFTRTQKQAQTAVDQINEYYQIVVNDWLD